MGCETLECSRGRSRLRQKDAISQSFLACSTLCTTTISVSTPGSVCVAVAQPVSGKQLQLQAEGSA